MSFDEIEGGTFVGPAAGAATVNINGTNADNDITVVGTATDSFTVSVDGGPAFAFNQMDILNVDGLAGDDDLDVAVDALALTTSISTVICPSSPMWIR